MATEIKKISLIFPLVTISIVDLFHCLLFFQFSNVFKRNILDFGSSNKKDYMFCKTDKTPHEENNLLGILIEQSHLTVCLLNERM